MKRSFSSSWKYWLRLAGQLSFQRTPLERRVLGTKKSITAFFLHWLNVLDVCLKQVPKSQDWEGAGNKTRSFICACVCAFKFWYLLDQKVQYMRLKWYHIAKIWKKNVSIFHMDRFTFKDSADFWVAGFKTNYFPEGDNLTVNKTNSVSAIKKFFYSSKTEWMEFTQISCKHNHKKGLHCNCIKC